jgi:hypothetical protein
MGKWQAGFRSTWINRPVVGGKHPPGMDCFHENNVRNPDTPVKNGGGNSPLEVSFWSIYGIFMEAAELRF